MKDCSQMNTTRETTERRVWSGAMNVPAGCPFQVRDLQLNVQVALDFLCPESVGELARLAEEIRCLPNDHEAKLQILEIGKGKISLYAASSAIKEVQKLILDPKKNWFHCCDYKRFGAELGFEDANLTKAVSNNLDKAIKQPQQNQLHLISQEFVQ